MEKYKSFASVVLLNKEIIFCDRSFFCLKKLYVKIVLNLPVMPVGPLNLNAVITRLFVLVLVKKITFLFSKKYRLNLLATFYVKESAAGIA